MQNQETTVPVSPPPRLDERFITSIQGKDFVLYAGLLDLAHQKGLIKLEVETLKFPSKENNNTAVCRATAVSEMGETFTDIGDADPANVNRKIAPHILRMASTRAKARALRDFCNIGITCLEELGDLEEAVWQGENAKPSTRTDAKANGNRSGRKTEPPPSRETRTEPPNQAQRQPAPQTGNTPNQATPSSPVATPKMSEAQRRAILNLGKRRGLADGELEALAQQTCGRELKDLTPQHAAQFIRTLQQTG